MRLPRALSLLSGALALASPVPAPWQAVAPVWFPGDVPLDTERVIGDSSTARWYFHSYLTVEEP